MNWLILCRYLGLLGLLIGGSMLLSLPWAFPLFGQVDEFDRRGCLALLGSFAVAALVGGGMFVAGRNASGQVLRKEALAIVGLGWCLAGILGGLPYLLSGTLRQPGVTVTPIDATFEAVSGFTTTGASLLTQLEDPAYIPRCILFWRSFTHWLGGMGIVVLFVAILSHLGASGKALMRREVPGPISESVRPRVRETALIMWTIYVSLSALLVLIYMLEGMTFFEAHCHTFGTMATGGFSTWNASLGHYDSPLIEWTTILFMGIAGANFSLYYQTLRAAPGIGERNLFDRCKLLFWDAEFRTYLLIMGVSALVIMGNLVWIGRYPPFEGLRHALFNVVSIMTTTGYGTEDFTTWPQFCKAIILALMYIGGCAGSTAGGVKVMRIILFTRIMRLEIERAFRPNVVRPLKISGVSVDPQLRHDVVVYISLLLTVTFLAWMTLSAIEPDAVWTVQGHSESEKLLDCASAVVSTLNNVGPGMGILGPYENYAVFSQPGKVLLTLCMLLGRLELFAILVLFVPAFWRTH